MYLWLKRIKQRKVKDKESMCRDVEGVKFPKFDRLTQKM